MRYLTLFLEAENVHLIKDVGMIPYTLYKEHGYQSTLACYRNGEYPYAEDELKGLNLVFVRKIFDNPFLDGLLFLLLNARKYDILQVYHLRFQSMFWLFLFKMLRPRSRNYLKLDANEQVLNYPQNGLKGAFNQYLFRKIDLVSVETASIQAQLIQQWGRAILLIPNGFLSTFDAPILFEHKKNKIITVGRIGAPEKRNELLLEAFATFCKQYQDWSLELIGPIQPSFNNYIHQYFATYPELKDKVTFTGAIQNRSELFKKYAAAKIFCITSAYEGFCISLVEAASAGCFLITSSVISAPDITANEKYGRIFPNGNLEELKKILVSVAHDETLLKSNCQEIQKFADEKFSWKVISQEINTQLKK